MERALVSASCGPCGRLLKPYGDIEPAEVYAGFEVQARAFLDGGADLICVETMTDLAEAVLAIRAAKAVAPAIPVVATMTFDRTPRGFFTIMGVTIERACEGLEEAGADIVGSNCGNGIDTMIEIAREFRARTRLPLAFRPNAGLPEVRAGAVVYPETPEFMAARIGALLDAGASIVGGCCGTTPEHIARHPRGRGRMDRHAAGTDLLHSESARCLRGRTFAQAAPRRSKNPGPARGNGLFEARCSTRPGRGAQFTGR